ncbi:methyltransferase domain-containing protein [Cohnella sp. CFH 77786]|uniref:class I SAM-dependent methyltransferase n=1 Tax=Cohnella sp. CFH 77786 TaxID=2662265 RepID=UPI001C608571|nr:class I SAM-dependent methyltransferase [Cohnella sp. CFH 77786]MBW5446931.1 methyltransferase domain-containing protein [Cohnella sp. CFH 77786]
MHLSPRLYHRIVRPRWFTKKFIHDPISSRVDLQNKSVLDFGCGTGANCGICDPDRYVGIDPDAGRIRFAQTLYPRHTFKVFDGKRIPLPDGAVDHIFIVAVLHHIPDGPIAGYLDEFRRVLRPRGTIVAIEPFLCPKNKLNNWFMQNYDNGEFVRTEEDYVKLFRHRNYDCEVLTKFKKCLLYHELFFTASPI